MVVTCMSFGYKYGIPPETDLLFDVRCLPNPFYIPELREHTGLEPEVQDYVLAGRCPRVWFSGWTGSWSTCSRSIWRRESAAW